MHMNIHNVKAIAARSNVLNIPERFGMPGYTAHSVTFDVMAKEGKHTLTLFVPSRDMADALANAINYANASTAVQTNHDKRLADAARQEYRDMVVALPEGV
jgi:hypothetical protein